MATHSILCAVVRTASLDTRDAPHTYLLCMTGLFLTLDVVVFQIVHMCGHVDWISESEPVARLLRSLRIPQSEVELVLTTVVESSSPNDVSPVFQ